MDLAFALTDFKFQGLTVDKLIVMLNLQGMNHDLATLYVSISRVRRIEDLKIWKLDIKNEEAIKHLLRIQRPEFIRLWRATYDEHGVWKPVRLAYARIAPKKKLMNEFLKAQIHTLLMHELCAWFTKCNLTKPRGKKTGKKTNLIMRLREYMRSVQVEIDEFDVKNEASRRSRFSRTTSEKSDISHTQANRSGHTLGMCSLVGSLQYTYFTLCRRDHRVWVCAEETFARPRVQGPHPRPTSRVSMPKTLIACVASKGVRRR